MGEEYPATRVEGELEDKRKSCKGQLAFFLNLISDSTWKMSSSSPSFPPLLVL